MSKRKRESVSLSSEQIRELINKKAGRVVAFNLKEEDPTLIPYWIPTGSRVLDSVIARGTLAGIPGGRVSSFAGLPSAGKSFMAAKIAANAQKMGIEVCYFDSESALNMEFMEDMGVDVDNLIYLIPSDVEFVLETVDALLGTSDNKYLFIWDSLAFTPCKKEMELDFNPNALVGLKARVMSGGMAKLVDPIRRTESAFLILNQLKTNITQDRYEAMTDPFVTPGGKAVKYAYSLEVWFTRKTSKAAYQYDDKERQIGAEIKAKIVKSRFGTEKRTCAFNIVWGEEIGIQDEESWWEVIKSSERVKSGAWNKIQYLDQEWSESFRSDDFKKLLYGEKFREAVFSIMNEELIVNFQSKGHSHLDPQLDEEEFRED